MTETKKDPESCCPEFHPEDWDSKSFNWKDKLFIKGRVFTFFYMPVNFGGLMRKADKLMKQSKAESPEWLALADHTTRWNMDVYIAVDKPVKGIENVTLSGQFYSRVFEGPYKDTKKWCDTYEADVKAKNREVKKWYMWYNYCPECSKKYGHNYTTIIGQLE